MKDEIKTVLAAVDFSDVTPHVLNAAKAHALAFKSKVILLHVSDPEPYMVGFEPGPVKERPSIAKKFHEEHKGLEKAKQPFIDAGIAVTALHIQGLATEKILLEIERQNTDLVIVGSHGHGTIHNLLIGSVATGMLKSSPCPVLIIPARSKHQSSP